MKPEIERELRDLLERAMYGADVRASFIMHLDRVRKAMRDALMLGTMLEQRHRNEHLETAPADSLPKKRLNAIALLKLCSEHRRAFVDLVEGTEGDAPVYAAGVARGHALWLLGLADDLHPLDGGPDAGTLFWGPTLATQNPLPTDPPQVPENTPAAKAPADPTQNDPIASAAAGTPAHCGPRAWILGRKCCPDCKHAEGPDRTISRCFGCGYPGDTDEIEVPTFNHTRGDSPLTPCPICAKAMGAELGREIGRGAVAAAEAAEQAAAETWGICEIDRKPHVLWRDHKCVGWVS